MCFYVYTSKSTFNGIHPEDTIKIPEDTIKIPEDTIMIPEDTSKNSKVFCEIEKYSDGNLIIFKPFYDN